MSNLAGVSPCRALPPHLPSRYRPQTVPPAAPYAPQIKWYASIFSQHCLGSCVAKPLGRQAVAAQAAPTVAAPGTSTQVQQEGEVEGMTEFLDSLKWDSNGLVVAICQHVDTGELLMQAFSDRAAVSETLQTGLATFYSRSRKGRWCKGEMSGHFIKVSSVYPDCDRDSLIYLSDPIGPACHTGAASCWFSEAHLNGSVTEAGSHSTRNHAPLTTLLALERTIQQRRAAMDSNSGGKPSWTGRLLADPALLCGKVREEAGELCATLEAGEGPERCASEMADLLYHAMVLLNAQGVSVEEVLQVLRAREGTSGVAEKAARQPKAQAP